MLLGCTVAVYAAVNPACISGRLRGSRRAYEEASGFRFWRDLVCSRVTWGFVKPLNLELSMTSMVSFTLSAQQKRTFLFSLWSCMHFSDSSILLW